MKKTLSAGLSLVFTCSLFAADPKDDKFNVEQAKTTYPLKVCVVSGEKLDGGDMGKPIDYVYKAEGKPDRLVRFCCGSCLADFKKDPTPYLAKLDAAAKK